MIISRTRAVCSRCEQEHPADLVRADNRIEGVIHCPEGEIRHVVSSDADLFMALREKSCIDVAEAPPPGLRSALHYLSITNACNLGCKICAADAERNTSNAVFLSMDEICRRAKDLRGNGARLLYLFGGEPVLHPDIVGIVRHLSRMGFSVGLFTNGYVPGKDPGLVRQLKHAGLVRIGIQFDSLKEDTLEKLGRNILAEKKAAIRHAVAAGLRVSLNCTVTTTNLDEIGELLRHGLGIGPSIRHLTFASAAPVGHFRLSAHALTDREQIVRQLLKTGILLDDVLPLPSYMPWRVQCHPDCGAHVLFLRTPKGPVLVNRLIDLGLVYQRLAKSRMRPNIFSRYVMPAFYVLRAIRPGKWRECLKAACGLVIARTSYSVINVGISNYKGACFLDEQRLARCPAVFATSVGIVKGCFHYFRSATYPGSRLYENAHGSC